MTTTDRDGGAATKIVNATVDSVAIRLDREFILTPWLFLNYGDGGHQGFGGWGVGGLPDTKVGRHHEQPNLCAEWLVGCLRAAGVDDWDKIKGKAIRVEYEGDWIDRKIVGIGHIIKDDCWFRPKEAIERLRSLSARTREGE